MDVLLAAVEYLKENEVQGGTENEQSAAASSSSSSAAAASPTGKKRNMPDYNYDDEVKNLPFGLRNLQYGEFQEIDDVYLNSQKYLKRYESTREPAKWYSPNTAVHPLLSAEVQRVKKFEMWGSAFTRAALEKERQLFRTFESVIRQRSVYADMFIGIYKVLWYMHQVRFSKYRPKPYVRICNEYTVGMDMMYSLVWVRSEMRKYQGKPNWVELVKTQRPDLKAEVNRCIATAKSLDAYWTRYNKVKA